MAHKLKSSSAIVGAASLLGMLKKLEEFCENGLSAHNGNGNKDRAGLMEALEREYEAVRREMASELGKDRRSIELLSSMIKKLKDLIHE